jgi:hypothetical protein
LIKNSAARQAATINDSEKAEKYFSKYASRVSRMNAWMIEEELARKLVEFDELEGNEDRIPLKEETMREIEILQSRKESKNWTTSIHSKMPDQPRAAV